MGTKKSTSVKKAAPARGKGAADDVKDVYRERIRDLEEKCSRLQDTEERLRRLRVLIEINTYITNSLEKVEVLNRILNQVRVVLDCEHSSILLVNDEVQRLEFAILTKEEDSRLLKDTSLRMGEGVAGTVWQNGTPVMIADTGSDPRFSDRADRKTSMHTRSLIAVPLTVDGRIIGVMEALNKKRDTFDDFDLQMLQYISTQSAIAIKNADLYNMATRDGMTKLYIHKYFKERLLEEFRRSQRKGYPLSLVMFDIDHFKSLNDTYGHQAGDRVLIEVARVIRDNTRAIDIPCRYGGEEFSIILPETIRDHAMAFSERIRGLIEALSIEYQGAVIRVTVSGGVATSNVCSPADTDEFIRFADRALYDSKEGGRNRVTFFSQPEDR
ncbi:MAG: sensor domain-containing diguanylate cyclase [Spirochaetes bacterium]|nr:sensor domain-containing diguanylate cyclase [Spirochaetota bacterium]